MQIRLMCLVIILGVSSTSGSGLFAQSAAAQSAALRIVVIQGEDAVNIIQQRTAVAPIVEVRDRNNLPVSGATVTFAIQGGNAAAFPGGVSTLSVTTNAAGQAVATGFAPTTVGPIQITATAVFQGQSVTATIAQTNFATAAQAAQSAVGSGSSAGASGTAGGASGGLSTTAIVGIAGGVAAGGLVALSASGGGDDSGTSSVATPACSYALNPSAQIAPENGGTFSTALATSCAWGVSSDAPWLNVSSGASGSGNATISYSVSPNTASARSGRLTVTGAGGTATLVVSQDAARTAGSWSGSVASSGTLPFGGPPFCSYAITFTDIRSTLVVGQGDAVTGGQVTLNATETAPQGCPFALIPPNPHTYTVRSGSITGSTVAVTYQPAAGNSPPSSLTFAATLASDGRTIAGTLVWHRTDTVSPLDWTVSVAMVLTRAQ